jgi:hypothetical protein
LPLALLAVSLFGLLYELIVQLAVPVLGKARNYVTVLLFCASLCLLAAIAQTDGVAAQVSTLCGLHFGIILALSNKLIYSFKWQILQLILFIAYFIAAAQLFKSILAVSWLFTLIGSAAINYNT